MSDPRSLPDDAIARILDSFGKCGSIRKTAQQTGHNPKTVAKYIKLAGLPTRGHVP